ncbi:MAG: hypothetical protein L3K09_03365 [Thermoplasmata archaeon]|nr:hypothetical protein [Thermoplasmata archaeon]
MTAVPPGSDWPDVVTVQRAPELERELAGRLGLGSFPPVFGVTDLIELRRAYYRRTAPVTPGVEQRRRMDAGRAAHLQILRLLGDPEYREVRVHGDGVVGEIDLLKETPTELKTTREIPEVATLHAVRPGYFEQLAMYCALVGKRSARLIVTTAPGPDAQAVVLACEFASTDRIWAEMRQRSERLRESLARRDPSGLPRCAWRDRGCEYQSAKVCACTGEEPEPSRGLVRELERAVPQEAETAALTEGLRALPSEGPWVASRFRDLLYPRRAYFERTSPEVGPEGAEPAAGSGARQELFRTLRAMLEAGPSGELSRRWAALGEPTEPVGCFRGEPYVIKTSRAWSPALEAGLARDQPQYVREVALRAGSLGGRSGLLIVGYERAASVPEGLRVFRVEFASAPELVGLVTRKCSELRSAIATQRPEELPACPGWMHEACPYRERCGCGTSVAGRT